MVKFGEGYHYINDCPLRRLDSDPLVKTPLAEWFEQSVSDMLLDTFIEGDYIATMNRFTAYVKTIGRLNGKRLKTNLFQTAVVNTLLYRSLHENAPTTLIGSFTQDDMVATVDMMRLKSNRTCELLWFKYDTLLPDAEQRGILSAWVQWNARAFELKKNIRPFQLTLYYPFIGDSIRFQYNTKNGLDVVAASIKLGAFYTRPQRKRCLQCRLCPEYLRMI